MKYGFVYIWFDSKRKMFYIGCHWGAVNDGYICSSKRMRDNYRNRQKDFKRRILKSNIQEKQQLLIEEYRWLQMIRKEELGKKYYNVTNHMFGHWMIKKDSSGPNHPMFGKHHTEETKDKYFRGKKVSEETKQKLRDAARKQFSDPENRRKAGVANIGRKPPITGKKHTPETILKIKEKRKNQIVWNKGLKTGPNPEHSKRMMGRIPWNKKETLNAI